VNNFAEGGAKKQDLLEREAKAWRHGPGLYYCTPKSNAESVDATPADRKRRRKKAPVRAKGALDSAIKERHDVFD